MKFNQKYQSVIQKSNSLVCVGLDSNIHKIPSHVKSSDTPQFVFNKAIIDATHDLVCAYKPNTAFYEARGEQGIHELKMTCDYIRTNYPDVLIILDAKRADIGSTNEGYATFAFDFLQADAITLHPYLGKEALQPFLDREDKGCILLCRTSNPGAGEFQDADINGEPLYKLVAKKVAREWNSNNNCMLVVGATYPEELAEIRNITEDMTFLVPGIGTQGGNVEKTIKAGLNSSGDGMIVNSSRGIIFASTSEDFTDKAREETVLLKEEINTYRV